MQSGIYIIKNTVNGKLYVGSAIDIRIRWNIHRSDLNLNKHHSILLQRSWNKYGESNFIFELIENCTKDNLIKCEQFWLDFFESYSSDIGYNVCKKAGSRLGMKHSEETKAKLRKPHSEETKRKIGEKSKGRKASPETLKKMSEASKGRHLGKKRSQETKDKISFISSNRSEETKKKISEGVRRALDKKNGNL